MVEDEEYRFSYPEAEWGVLMDSHGSMDIYESYEKAKAAIERHGGELVLIQYKYFGTDDD